MPTPVKEEFINFPAIAAKTYKRFSSDVFMIKITNKVLKRLNKISSAVRRARFVHKEINNHLSVLFQDPMVEKHISCRKGCSACCHTQVSISDDEAALLAKLVNGGVNIDMAKLKSQSAASKSATLWYQIPFEERGCVFLDENKECTVYNDRPAVCRTNHVVGSPEDCSTEAGVVKSVKLLNTFEADMTIMAGFAACENNGALPSLLFDLLENKETKETRDTMSPKKHHLPVFKEL
ncbi:hypothetical protein A9Q84_03835 [Halobacteriovorax marinus]|uniref:YkgJ family cysteine cluster protein n=1 Tax=Halobacteriovorax marinus TaxID=97084 RepID=A0A1Y5FFX4_9BACT|nr:hypothetical protein A9Q84_03835 [Halobacteriovorax marinus]